MISATDEAGPIHDAFVLDQHWSGASVEAVVVCWILQHIGIVGAGATLKYMVIVVLVLNNAAMATFFKKAA